MSPLSSKASETEAEATSSSMTEAIAEKKGITTKETTLESTIEDKDFSRSSLAISKLLSRDNKFWLGLDTISRVVGVLSDDFSLDWDVSGAGLVLNFVSNSLFISEGSFVGDDWDFTGLSGDLRLVLNFVDGVDTGLLLGSVLSSVLDSDVFIEYSVVSGLSLLSVENSVLVGVASLWLVSVLSDGVWPLEDFDLVSVSVLLLLSVEDLVMSFVSGEWDISPLGLSVETIGKSWLPGEASVHVWSVLDLVGLSVPEFFLWLVLGFDVFAGGLDWDLSGSDFRFSLGFDGVLNFVIEDLNVSEEFLSAVLDMSVLE